MYIVEEEEYQDGEVIFREGSPTDWVYVILQGRVKIQKKTPHGLLTVTTLDDGNFLGEMAFFERSEVHRSASALAVGHVRLAVLDRDRLAKEYDSLSPAFRKVVLTLVHRLRRVTAQATTLSALKG